jgi:hypothetical protein
VTGRARTTVVRVLAVAVVVVLGRVLMGDGRSAARPVSPPAAPVVVAPAETPTQAALRLLTGYARYPALGVEGAVRDLRQVSTTGAGDRLVAMLRDDFARLAAGYPGGPTRFWIGPLATRTTATDVAHARVEVWFSRVVAPPAKPVYVEWRLGVLDVVRERNAWRLDAIDERPGPRPDELPGEADGAAEIDSSLSRFVVALP